MQVRTGDFFFPFFPPSSCAPLPAPDNPHASLRTLMPRIESAHAIASLDKHCPPHPPQSHSCRCLYATLAPLCMPALKPCTCTTHSACGLAFLWGLEPVSLLYFFFTFTFFSLYFFFFFSPVHLHTLSTCIQTPSLRAPTLTWPEGKTAAPSQGLDDGNYLYPPLAHVPCPTHSFNARPPVGTQQTTLFDPQRDHWH